MQHGFRRGSVVACAKHVGVVWDVDGRELRVVPVRTRPRQQLAHDVELAEAECGAAGLPADRAVLRASQLLTVDAGRQVLLGELQGRAVCRLVAAVARAAVAAGDADKWESDRRHRQVAIVPGALSARNQHRVVRCR